MWQTKKTPWKQCLLVSIYDIIFSVGYERDGWPSPGKEVVHMTVFEAMYLMIALATLVVLLIKEK